MARTIYNTEYFQELAKNRNGKLLSTSYINIREKLLWECEENHVWHTSPMLILRGCWCPECARKKDRKRIQKKEGDKNTKFEYPKYLRAIEEMKQFGSWITKNRFEATRFERYLNYFKIEHIKEKRENFIEFRLK